MKNDPIVVRTCKVRVSYPSLIEPYASEKDLAKGKTPSYSVTMMFDPTKEADKECLNQMKVAVNEAIKKKYGNNPPVKLKKPFRKGVPYDSETAPMGYDLEKHPYYEGMIIVSARNTRKPGVMDKKSGQRLGEDPALLEQHKQLLYPGHWGIAVIRAYVYSNESTGVSFSLDSYIKMADDEPIAGGNIKPEDAFADLLNDPADEQAHADELLDGLDEDDLSF